MVGRKYSRYSIVLLKVLIISFLVFVSQFNYPVQLGPSSPSRPGDARRYELSVQADDILILASDGMSDNCWEEDVLDEVRRAVEVHLPLAQKGSQTAAERKEDVGVGMLGRRTLAGMLSEALCSRARQMSTQRRAEGSNVREEGENKKDQEAIVEDLPFERRAREEGRSFRGGKCDGEPFHSAYHFKRRLLCWQFQIFQCSLPLFHPSLRLQRPRQVMQQRLSSTLKCLRILRKLRIPILLNRHLYRQTPDRPILVVSLYHIYLGNSAGNTFLNNVRPRSSQ